MPRFTKNSTLPPPGLPEQPGETPASTSRKPKPVKQIDSPDGLSEEGKLIFSLLLDRLDAIVAELRARDDRLNLVETENANLKTRIVQLEERLDDAESYNRSTNLVLSGNALTTLSGESTVHAVSEMCRSKLQYELPSNCIHSAFRMGPKPLLQSPDSRRVMVKFRDSARRDDVLSACRKVKTP